MARIRKDSGRRERISRMQRANARGVTAIRRPLESESFEIFRNVNKKLTTELRGTDRLFTPETLTVTVIGFRRFNQRLKDRGPATEEVMAEVGSVGRPIPAILGRLGIYGSGNYHKLAFEVHSAELEEEIATCEKVYKAKEFPLLPDFNAGDDLSPHCSIAWLHRSTVGHHAERKTLARYNSLAGVMGQKVLLAPPARPEMRQAGTISGNGSIL